MKIFYIILKKIFKIMKVDDYVYRIAGFAGFAVINKVCLVFLNSKLKT